MRRIAVCAVLAAMAAGACGGDDEGGAPGGGAPTATGRTTAAAPADPLARLREQTEARCTKFVRDVLQRPLPRTDRGEDRWFAALRRMERQLVADLRRLDVPQAHASAYRRALSARSRSLRDKRRTAEDIERAASELRPYNPHACRYWGVRALGKDGVQFAADQSWYCVEDARKIEEAARAARTGRISKQRASRRIARTLRRSARLMRVEAPPGAARRWRELRTAVDALGDAFHTGLTGATDAQIRRFNARVNRARRRTNTASWALGIGNCDFHGPLNDAIVATDPNRPRGARS